MMRMGETVPEVVKTYILELVKNWVVKNLPMLQNTLCAESDLLYLE